MVSYFAWDKPRARPDAGLDANGVTHDYSLFFDRVTESEPAAEE